MKVLISGASGLIGTELIKQLKESGHQPIRLVRRSAKSSDEMEWNPAVGKISGTLDGFDAVVNLAGATTGKIPWTKTYKNELISSRIDSTRTLVEAIRAAANPPKVLISGSASGYYGDCGDQSLNESAPKGTGFLSDLAAAWEAEAQKAPSSVRVVLVRTTMVMSRRLGALGRLFPLIKLGVGGPLGSGKQWWAWITLRDEAAAIIHLIKTESASGVFNLTAPEPATCSQLISSLAKKLKRPFWFPAPAFALKLVLGEAATELLLCSQKMTADRLLATGFRFQDATLDQASSWVTGR
ncbi:MAG: TIGR01777 family oxidoreductase [Rhodoluna sp.]